MGSLMWEPPQHFTQHLFPLSHEGSPSKAICIPHTWQKGRCLLDEETIHAQNKQSTRMKKEEKYNDVVPEIKKHRKNNNTCNTFLSYMCIIFYLENISDHSDYKNAKGFCSNAHIRSHFMEHLHETQWNKPQYDLSVTNGRTVNIVNHTQTALLAIKH